MNTHEPLMLKGSFVFLTPKSCIDFLLKPLFSLVKEELC